MLSHITFKVIVNVIFQGITMSHNNNKRHNHAEVWSKAFPGHPSHTSVYSLPISLSGIFRYIDQHPLQRILTV